LVVAHSALLSSTSERVGKMISNSSHARTIIDLLNVNSNLLNLAEELVKSDNEIIAARILDIATDLQRVAMIEILDTELELGFDL
jgi:uncharacterized protein with NRDE domain